MGRSSLLAIGVALAGCHQLFGLDNLPDAIPGDGASDRDGRPRPDAAPCMTWGSWEVVALPELNAPGVDDYAPSITADHRRIVFHSERDPEGAYEAVWDIVNKRFGAPVRLDLPNYAGGPFISADGLTIWYDGYIHSDRDILVATRNSFDADFGLADVVPGLAIVGTPERDIAFDASGLEAVLVYGSGETQDVVMTVRGSPTDPFPPPQPVAAAAYDDYDCCPTLSADGLTLMWEGGSPYGIHIATRPDRMSEFGNPTLFVPLQDGNDNGDPQLSYDASHLVYASNRAPGEEQDYDIYMLKRECLD